MRSIGGSCSDHEAGYVRTRMTAGLTFPNILTARPSTVAEVIFRVVSRADLVVYVSWIWQVIMFAIRALPERLFKSLSF